MKSTDLACIAGAVALVFGAPCGAVAADEATTTELSVIRGRAADESSAREKSAADVRLRDISVLQHKGAFAADLALSYTFNPQRYDINSVITRSETRAANAALGMRYGLTDSTQLTVGLPFSYQRTKAEYFTGEQSSISQHDTGDLSLGLHTSLVGEGVGRPGIIGSFSVNIPTQSRSGGVGAGVAFSKSVDPVVLYATASLVKPFHPQVGGSRYSMSTALGFSFAVNERISLGAALSSHYAAGSRSESSLATTREAHRLTFSLTGVLSKKFYVEPSVSFGLGNTNDVVLGLAMPLAF